MHAIAACPAPVRQSKRIRARAPAPPPGGHPIRGHAAGDRGDELRRSLDEALESLAEARAQARRAEARLRSRLVALTWPAVLSGIAGGFAAVVALRLAGL